MPPSSGLVDAHGRPLVANYKKATPPTTQPLGSWGGPTAGLSNVAFPGTTTIGMNLDNLTLNDFQVMRDHPQVNASLSVLSFMQHQSPWKIVCDDKKLADLVHEELERNWTQLNRAMAQANWAGYSPCVLEWENDVDEKVVRLAKVKDLEPSNAWVHWKEITGWAPPGRLGPKIKIYDGIDQFGQPGPLPKENTFWYPVLMENGDYYGRKLLRSAFQPWYFSILTHLYANRYYDRYSEPTPMGRAPFGDTITVGTENYNSNEYMASQLMSLRNRSVVVLPTDGQWTEGKFMYDYDMKFMESQQRGADFERYLERLDEEISLALFTPVLLMRTADVGSYNLGQGHMQVYLWMMNAMNADRAFYINKYLIAPIAKYNSNKANPPECKIEFKKLGDTDTVTVKELLTALINHGGVRPNLKELGEMAGLTLEEVAETTAPAPTPAATPDPNQDPNADPNVEPKGKTSTATGTTPPPSTNSKWLSLGEIENKVLTRVQPQIRKSYERGEFRIDPGHVRELAGYYASVGRPEGRRAAEGGLAALAEETERMFHQFGTADELVDWFVSNMWKYFG